MRIKLIKGSFISSYKNVLSKKYISIYFIYFSFFLFNGPIETIAPIFVEDKGFGEKTYGLILSISTAINVFLPGLVAYVSDKYNAYKISMIGMGISFIVAICLGVQNMSLALVVILLVGIIACRTIFNYSFGNTINFHVMSEHRGKYFAARDLFLFGAISISLFLGGKFVDLFSISHLFSLLGIGFIVPLILIAFFNKKYPLKKVLETSMESENDKKQSFIRADFFNKKVIAFILIDMGTTVYSIAMKFLPLLGVERGISVSGIMTMFGFITIGNSLIALWLGHLTDDKGRKGLFVFDLAFDILPAFVFVLTSSIPFFVFGIFLTMIKDALAPMSYAYYYDCFDGGNGPIIMGLLTSVSNFIGILAPFLIGIAWETYSAGIFYFAVLGNGMSAIMAFVLLPNIKKAQSIPT